MNSATRYSIREVLVGLVIVLTDVRKMDDFVIELK